MKTKCYDKMLMLPVYDMAKLLTASLNDLKFGSIAILGESLFRWIMTRGIKSSLQLSGFV